MRIDDAVIFPTVNDVNGGKRLDEENLASMIRALTGMTDHVVHGLCNLDLSSDELSFTLPAGVAVIGGYVVAVPETVVPLPPNSVNYLYLVLSRDGLGHVTGAEIVVSASAETPTDGMALYSIETSDVRALMMTKEPLYLDGWAVKRAGDYMTGRLDLQNRQEVDRVALLGMTAWLPSGGRARYTWRIANGELELAKDVGISCLRWTGPEVVLESDSGKSIFLRDKNIIMQPCEYAPENVLASAPAECVKPVGTTEFALVKQFRVARPGQYTVSMYLRGGASSVKAIARVEPSEAEDLQVVGTNWTRVEADTSWLNSGDTIDVFWRHEKADALKSIYIKDVELLGIADTGYTNGIKVLKD